MVVPYIKIKKHSFHQQPGFQEPWLKVEPHQPVKRQAAYSNPNPAWDFHLQNGIEEEAA
jgi:hypothetical protein